MTLPPARIQAGDDRARDDLIARVYDELRRVASRLMRRERADHTGVRLERGRRFGDGWLAWQIWRALGLDRKIQGLLPWHQRGDRVEAHILVCFLAY